MNRILIIDDSTEDLKTLIQILGEDYHISAVKNGKEGLRLSEKNQPTLILLDIVMPDMNGYEVLEKLKSSELTKYIPVIIMTVLSDHFNEEKGLKLGAVDYITKPFNARIIQARIRTQIDNFLYRRTVENLALLDGLTGIFNRRSFEDKIKTFWQQAIHDRRPISIALADIDFFKPYNDNYGHQNGDEILKMVVNTMVNTMNPYHGMIARYGGEEFVMILPNTGKEVAMQVMEEVRKSIEQLGITHLYSKAGEVVTVSIGGISTVPYRKQDLEGFLKLMDQKLYAAKETGRNKVIWEEKEELDTQTKVMLFGCFELEMAGKTITAKEGTSKQIWSVLEYLIVHRRTPVPKEELAEILWPEHPVDHPEYALERLVRMLKEILFEKGFVYDRDIILETETTYQWNPGIDTEIDMEEFECRMKRISHSFDEPEKQDICTQILKLYRGEFLQENPSAQWAMPIRKRYHVMYLNVVHELLKSMKSMKYYDKMIEICEKAMLKEELDEEIHYNYIYCLSMVGKNREAIKHYQHMSDLFFQKLGTTANEKTAALYQQILKNTENVKKDIETINADLKEPGPIEGIFYCEYEYFRKIYHLEARMIKRMGIHPFLGLINIQKELLPTDSGQITEELMMHLFQIINHLLRQGDIISRLSDTQYIILLQNINFENSKMVMERIMKEYHNHFGDECNMVSYYLRPMDDSDESYK